MPNVSGLPARIAVPGVKTYTGPSTTTSTPTAAAPSAYTLDTQMKGLTVNLPSMPRPAAVATTTTVKVSPTTTYTG